MPANKNLGAAGLDDVLTVLRELQSELAASRQEVHSLSRRIELLLPAEVLIDVARDRASGNTPYAGLLRMALNDLRLKYNPFNLNTVRRLLRGAARA